MTRTIWLASYPKSANTWMRILIANVLSAVDQPADINKIRIGGMAGDRGSFDYEALIDSGLLTHDEIDLLRPRVYACARHRLEQTRTGADASGVKFAKVHDAYMFNPAGEPLLGGAQGASRAILIVRDPRDVGPSLAHHLNYSIDEAIAFMNDEDAAFHKQTHRQAVQLRQKLRSWSAHVASWWDQKDIPVYLIRYEDLRSNTASILGRALEFSGLRATDNEINRAVAFSEFAELQQQEQKNGFGEAPVRQGTKFFRRGRAGCWREELTREQVARIESRHGQMMRRLGYDLSYAFDWADAG